jgi:heme exporter protein CcmD
MNFDNPHIGFVVASYGITAFVLLSLIGWILLRARRTADRLRLLEAEGGPRRRRADTTS